MDKDPPVPPSSSSKNNSKPARKLKFMPKPPVKRKPVLVFAQSTSSGVASQPEQDSIRKVNELFHSRVPKSEKKSSDYVIAGSSRPQDLQKKEKDVNSKTSLNLKEASGKNKYKEPRANNSNYKISIPSRPPNSGDSDVLDDKVNSALELGLLGMGDDDEKQIMHFIFPDQLPMDLVQVSLKGKEKVGSSKSLQEDASNKRNGLQVLPNGYMGKMSVYKSGAIKLKLGDTIFNVSSGTPCLSDLSVAAMMNTASNNCCVLCKVDRRAIVTPDLNSILENIEKF